MKSIYSAFALIAALLLSACSSSDFSITATIDGYGQQSVTMTYYADGRANRVTTPPGEDGKYHFKGSAEEPTLVELTGTASDRLLAVLVVHNGENLKCTISAKNPYDITVKGSKQSALMADFMRENANIFMKGSAHSVNLLIKQFVVGHPGATASTALLASMFDVEQDQALADSLLNIIEPSARPLNIIENFTAVVGAHSRQQGKSPVRTMSLVGRSDSVFTYTPSKHSKALLAFTGSDIKGRDSVTRVLRQLQKEFPDKKKLLVLEVSLEPDSLKWRRIIKADSARWEQAWVAGAAAAVPIERLHISRTPYFIVADSTGRQLLRTSSATKAAASLRH